MSLLHRERLEREAKDADEDTRLALRQERSVPVLTRIKEWLGAEGQVVLPRSPMGLAIGYAQNQWAALHVYVTQGFLRAIKRGRSHCYDGGPSRVDCGRQLPS